MVHARSDWHLSLACSRFCSSYAWVARLPGDVSASGTGAASLQKRSVSCYLITELLQQSTASLYSYICRTAGADQLITCRDGTAPPADNSASLSRVRFQVNRRHCMATLVRDWIDTARRCNHCCNHAHLAVVCHHSNYPLSAWPLGPAMRPTSLPVLLPADTK